MASHSIAASTAWSKPVLPGRLGSTTRASLGGALLFAAIAFALTQLGTRVLTDPVLHTSAWWPSAGLALAVLARSSRRQWTTLLPALAIGIFLSLLYNGATTFSAGGFAVANCLEGSVAALVLRGRRPRFGLLTSASDAVRLILGSTCGVLLASLVVAVRAELETGAWTNVTQGYALSHCLGLVLLTPLLLSPTAARLRAEVRRGRQNLEWLLQLSVAVAVANWVFVLHTGVPVSFLIVFPLLWGAARLGPLRTMISVLAVSLMATVGTHRGHGPFTGIVHAWPRLWALQLLLAVSALATLGLVLEAQARQRVTDALREREESLADAQRLAQLGSWSWDVESDELRWSPELYRITGLDPDGFRPTFESFRALTCPQDQPVLRDTIAGALGSGRPWEVEYRIIRSDGDVRILHGKGRREITPAGVTRLIGVTQDVTDQRRAARELAEARDLFAGVLNAATEQSIIGTDLSGRITVFNVGAERMLGYSAAEMLGSLPMRLHDPAEIELRALELGIEPGSRVFVEPLTAGAASDTRQWTYLTRDGRRLEVMVTVTAMRDTAGTVVGYIGVGNDVTDQRRAEAALLESEYRFRLAFDSASVGMHLVSLEPATATSILRVNQAMCDLLGRPADELVGRSVLNFGDPSELKPSLANYRKMVDGEIDRGRREKLFRHADGSEVWTQQSVAAVRSSEAGDYAIVLLEDITARKKAEQALLHQSLHDPLTGLANRTLLWDRLEHALAAATRSTRPVGVLFIDLDGFKQVNDTAGHAAGDELLVQVSQRLVGVVRPGDTVSRLGGDEFAVLCPDVDGPDSIAKVADRVLHALVEPFSLAGGPERISASIGVSLSSVTSTADALLDDADVAMYSAKKAGKNRVGFRLPVAVSPSAPGSYETSAPDSYRSAGV